MAFKKKEQLPLFTDGETPVETPAPVVAAEPKSATTAPKAYKVLEDKTINVRGSMTVIRKGQTIDPDGYDIANLLSQDVKLEEV
jgi:hypothetical protein